MNRVKTIEIVNTRIEINNDGTKGSKYASKVTEKQGVKKCFLNFNKPVVNANQNL